MIPLTIRTATSADAAALSRLITHTMRVSNAPDYDHATVERLSRRFSPTALVERIANEQTFVGEHDGSPVATAGLHGNLIRTMFVAPDAQGQGVGQRMLAHIEATARTNEIALLTVNASITARGFYERFGFHFVRFKEHDEGATFVMEKSLL